MLTDEQVLFLRRKRREDGTLHQPTYAREFGVRADAIGKAVRGVFFKHLDAIEPPISGEASKSDLRKKARRLYSEGNLSYNGVIEKLGISSSTMSLWCRDIKQRLIKPFLSREEYAAKKKEARVLYRQGKTTEEIATLIDIGRQTIGKWCRDLIQEGKKDKRPWKIAAHKSRLTKNKTQSHLFTDDKVIALRERVRREGKMDCLALGKELNFRTHTVFNALTGITFKHLNETIPPITDIVDQRTQKKRRVKRVLSQEELDEKRRAAAALRQAVIEEIRYEKWAKAGFPADWGNVQ